LAKVDEKQIAIWAAETEMSADGAGARMGGNGASRPRRSRRADEALAMNRRVRASGYPSEVAQREGAISSKSATSPANRSARADGEFAFHPGHFDAGHPAAVGPAETFLFPPAVFLFRHAFGGAPAVGADI
jgi:hypothetical protein